jgi:drug/metabolite transporter (DMT)-like permease
MSRRGVLLFAAMCVIWGIPYLLIRVAVREISPAALVLGRTAIAALITRSDRSCWFAGCTARRLSASSPRR